MEKIINLTPHTINVGDRIFEPQGVVRLSETTISAGSIDDIPIIYQKRTNVIGLPKEEKDIWVIVSRPVFDALPNRLDLLAVGEAIRDEQGRIIGCKNLVTH